jgi:catechol-2,3-dioxygenase
MHIHELELLANDLAELRVFYGELLGLPVLQASEAILELRVGTTVLRFVQAPVGWQGFYHFAFNIPENQLSEASAWLQQRVPLIADRSGNSRFRSESWNAEQIYFYDPAGNIGELIARHGLANATSDPFGAQHLLNVSEIGLAVDDVPRAAGGLRKQFGIETYLEASDTFTPLGDEHGLLIVVQQGRIWFPDTGKAAVPAAVVINGWGG